ncbi:hypothetical protein CRYUN_Cryun34aG0067200 [Craigia yunnanensis]
MALCSTFCPHIPNNFRATPISSFPSKPLLSLSFKPFSSQAPDASSQDKFSGRVGFLGLGIMGSPMAQNLIKAGYRYSPEEVTANCDITFAMLADPESAIDVACGKNGAVSGMAPGKGSSFRFQKASRRWTTDISYCSMMASFSEGLLLSKKVGLDPNVLVEVVSQGAISAPMYSLKGPSMVKSHYPTSFPLKHQQKSVSQSIPIAAASNELYKVAKSYSLNDEDFSAVIEALKAKSHNPA